jgi:hypothetical protein
MNNIKVLYYLFIMSFLEEFFNKKIEYSSNTEYRKCMRELFNMNPTSYKEKVESIGNLDDETEDEISYDEQASEKAMDFIYDKTKDHALFHSLYVLAAGKFLSQDPLIGEAVLFSYDYLSLFYLCLVDYFKSNEFTETNNNYINLFKKIS